MKIGVYIIKNECADKVYIGQSTNIDRRLYNHKRLLRLKEHENDYLQKHYKKYGSECFSFSSLEHCSVDSLDDRERYWINHYESMSRSKGYNLESGGNANKTFSEERIAKITGPGNSQYGTKRSEEWVKMMTLHNRANSDLLDEDDVADIKSRVLDGEMYKSICNDYNLHISTVSKIARVINWYWVREDLNEKLLTFRENQKRARDSRIQDLWEKEHSISRISKETGAGEKYIREFLGKQFDDREKAKEEENKRIEKAVAKDYRNGVSRAEIFKRYNVSDDRYLKVISPILKEKRQQRINKIHELKNEGYSGRAISEMLNINKSTVFDNLKKKPSQHRGKRDHHPSP